MTTETDPLQDAVRNAFGDTVRELRRERGIAQEKLAQLAGIDRAYAGMLERAEHTPSLVLLLKIACGLKMTLEAFAGRYDSHLKRQLRRRGLKTICPDNNR